MQARWRGEDLAFARALADTLLQRFEDRERGGFWFTAEGAETPLYRPKGFADEAMPAGNGVAAAALARLGWLAGETRYLDAAERTLRGGFLVQRERATSTTNGNTLPLASDPDNPGGDAIPSDQPTVFLKSSTHFAVPGDERYSYALAIQLNGV